MPNNIYNSLKLQVIHRLDRLSVNPNLEVKMRSGYPTGSTRFRNGLSALDLVSNADLDSAFADMAVQRPHAAAVVDNHAVAVAAPPFRDNDRARFGRMNVGALRNGEINAGMQLALSVTG